MSKEKPTYSEVWEVLNNINLNNKTDKKGNFTYLSWTDAWLQMMTHFPDLTYEFFPETYESNHTVMTHCAVRIGSLERTMWLPVMDNRRNSIANPTTREIQDTRMRCLVKCLAMYGLGNYIYRAEDFPDPEKDKAEREAKIPSNWNVEKFPKHSDFGTFLESQSTDALHRAEQSIIAHRKHLKSLSETIEVERINRILKEKGIDI